MNLRGVYEIFYPGKVQDYPSVWKEKPRYRSQKDFFEELVPMELRWLNIKVWNDKARRSRFFTDGRAESRYLLALKDMILQKPMVISRIEGKGCLMLQEGLSPKAMNQVFFQIAEQEQISFSPALKRYLMEEEGQVLKENWGNVLAFLLLYAIFPGEVNQLYVSYLHRKENMVFHSAEEQQERDGSLFQYEYPPDMSVQRPGEWLTHTWVIKNVGEIPWKNRRYECIHPPEWLDEENRNLKIEEVIYPGDTVSLTVHFRVPDTPGTYMLNWKMKNQKGEMIFLARVGLGVHFTVQEPCGDVGEKEENNYRILEENPVIPATLLAGKVYEHSWTIENIGTETWEDYYGECINGEAVGYTRNELRIPMKKKIEPGERVNLQIEFVTPPIEGTYKLIWRIMKKGGKPAFPEGRQLEVMLNLV